MAVKTAWAIRDRLININQLDRDTERGFKCNCFCISCGSVLVARMGDHTAYHFAHNSGYNCSIGSISDSITTAYSNPIYIKRLAEEKVIKLTMPLQWYKWVIE